MLTSRSVGSLRAGAMGHRHARGPKLKATTSDEQYVLSAFEPVRSMSTDAQRARSPPREPRMRRPLVPRGRGPTESAVLEAAWAGAQAGFAIGRATGALPTAAVPEAAGKTLELNSPSTTKDSETSMTPNAAVPGFVDTFGGSSPSDESARVSVEAQEHPAGSWKDHPAHSSSSIHERRANHEQPRVFFVPDSRDVEAAQQDSFYEHPVVESVELQSMLGTLREEEEAPWMPSPAGSAMQDDGMRDVGVGVVETPEDEGSPTGEFSFGAMRRSPEDRGAVDESFSPLLSRKVTKSRFASWAYQVPPAETRVGKAADSLALKADDFVPPPLILISRRVLESPPSKP